MIVPLWSSWAAALRRRAPQRRPGYQPVPQSLMTMKRQSSALMTGGQSVAMRIMDRSSRAHMLNIVRSL
jgi:hypothetical protein